jgi:hypothetical protein
MPTPNPASYPQIPNTPFVEGDAFTPALADLALAGPFFTGLSFKGHRDPLEDSELSSLPGSVKPRLASLESALKLANSNPATRVIEWSGGSVRKADDTLVAVAGGSFTAPASSTTWVWFDDVSNSVQNGPVAPNLKGLIGRVVTSVNTVTTLEDLRSPAIVRVLPTPGSIRCLGGQSTLDKTCVQGEVFNRGEYYFRNFTIPAGVTVTFSTSTKLYCSGNVSIQGAGVVTPSIPGAFNTGVAINNSATITGNRGEGLGALGQPYGFGTQAFGSGGSHGMATGLSANFNIVQFPTGGPGGGGLVIYAAGSISIPSGGSLSARGGNASEFSSLIGHGISFNLSCAISGSGGGSGGFIGLYSRTSVICAGTLDVRGGDGGYGYITPGSGGVGAQGGMGGSGGWIDQKSPNNNNTSANIQLGGGAYGTWANWAVSGGTLTITANLAVGTSNGGAFAANSTTHTISNVGNNYTVILNNNTANGSILYSNDIPVG